MRNTSTESLRCIQAHANKTLPVSLAPCALKASCSHVTTEMTRLTKILSLCHSRHKTNHPVLTRRQISNIKWHYLVKAPIGFCIVHNWIDDDEVLLVILSGTKFLLYLCRLRAKYLQAFSKSIHVEKCIDCTIKKYGIDVLNPGRGRVRAKSVSLRWES